MVGNMGVEGGKGGRQWSIWKRGRERREGGREEERGR